MKATTLAHDDPKPLFRGLADEHLLKLGVPGPLLSRVRGLYESDKDELRALADQMPPATGRALLKYAKSYDGASGRRAMASASKWPEGSSMATLASQPGTMLYHGGLPETATLSDIDLNRLGSQQNKRGRDYGGFYLVDDSSLSWALNYAKTRNGVLHGFLLKPSARVLDLGDKVIDRLTAQERADHAKDYDIIKGKDLLKRAQYVLLNKDAIGGVAVDKEAALSATAIYNDESGKFWGSQGAGAVFFAEDTGRFLLQHRSPYVNEPNTWGVIGGAIDAGEDPKEAMIREVKEETGYSGPMEAELLYTFQSGKFRYHNFLVTVPHEFEPKHGWESQGHVWATLNDLPSPLHFGFEALLPAIEHKFKDESKSVAARVLMAMQTPTSVDGLRFALKGLGFGSALDGLDTTSPNAQEQAQAQVEWLASKQRGSEARKEKARILLSLFRWPSAVKAARTSIPAPEGTKPEVFKTVKKTGPKKFTTQSTKGRQLTLLADAEKLLAEVRSMLP
jgi:8-oxo-dGTP pyrophosphatase MutT (NUDIX family)